MKIVKRLSWLALVPWSLSLTHIKLDRRKIRSKYVCVQFQQIIDFEWCLRRKWNFHSGRIFVKEPIMSVNRFFCLICQQVEWWQLECHPDIILASPTMDKLSQRLSVPGCLVLGSDKCKWLLSIMTCVVLDLRLGRRLLHLGYVLWWQR